MMIPIPIHGSVDDAHTILLGAREEGYFPLDFKEDIQKEQLNWWRIDGTDYPDYKGRPSFGWVFWCQLGEFKTELDPVLVQFWAATKTSEGRTLLTTQFQPFALGPTYTTDERNQLCSYRMGMCREYNNSFYADAECAQEQLGLPGRVFINQLPESTPHVEDYTLEEYPQRDLALRCEIGSSLAVPVFDHSSHTCVGVLEIVSLRSFVPVSYDKSFLGQMYDIFQECGLLCFDGCQHYKIQIGDENKARTTAFQELKTVLETVCRIHKLPLAMTWVPCSACNYLLQGQLTSGVEVFEYSKFNQALLIEVSKCSHLRKGGVVGMVLSSPNVLYCSDITQLSVVEYPLVPYARRCEFGGWFTICLQSSYTANDNYVLEFFLPRSNRYYGDNSWTSLSLILGTMEENFRTFKLASGQELGDLLSVEVMDFLKGQKLHYVKKIPAMDVAEDEDYIWALQNDEMMELFSSHQPPLDPPNSGQNVVIAERNTITVTSSVERKRKTQRERKGTGLRIEVPLEDILKCAKMSLKGAAAKLQVSRSTLKRVCGYHGIDGWPPRNIKEFHSFRPSPVKNEGQTRQCVNSDLPSNQASDSVAHTKPAFQDADIVTIRANYENNTIKFRLSLPYRLVALQQEVALRLNLEAGTYHVRYKDEENELILIACDQDLQDCIHTSKSLGTTSVVVLLEPK